MFPLPRVGDALLAHWANYIRLRRACQSIPRYTIPRYRRGICHYRSRSSYQYRILWADARGIALARCVYLKGSNRDCDHAVSRSRADQPDSGIDTYLKSFKVPAFHSNPITIRQLLGHTSGLDDAFVGSAYLDSAGPQPRVSEMMRRYLPHSVYMPGQVRLYSNFGYGVLWRAN